MWQDLGNAREHLAQLPPVTNTIDMKMSILLADLVLALVLHHEFLWLSKMMHLSHRWCSLSGTGSSPSLTQSGSSMMMVHFVQVWRMVWAVVQWPSCVYHSHINGWLNHMCTNLCCIFLLMNGQRRVHPLQLFPLLNKPNVAVSDVHGPGPGHKSSRQGGVWGGRPFANDC